MAEVLNMATLYETPAQPTAADLIDQEERFTISDPPALTYTLSSAPALDADGDPLLNVMLNGWRVSRGENYTIVGAVITWTAPALEAGEVLIITYTPSP